MKRASLFISGTPVTQGSMRAFQSKGRIVLASDNPNLAAWRRRVAVEINNAWKSQVDAYAIEGPITLEATFFIPRPKSRRDMWPTSRPDLDKLLRAIFDAGQDAGLWKNDSQIVSVRSIKAWADAPAEPGVRLTIHAGAVVDAVRFEVREAA